MLKVKSQSEFIIQIDYDRPEEFVNAEEEVFHTT